MGNVFINNNSKIYVFNKVKIGDNCIIAEDVFIRNSDNHKLIYDGYKNTAPIIIEDNVWIGTRATILKGVTIESGSVVAGSVVTKNVPKNSLVAGVPARVIKTNIEWKR